MATQGTYKGVTVNTGTDAEIAAQMAAIDSKNAPAVTQSTSPTYGVNGAVSVSSMGAPAAPFDVPTYAPPPLPSAADIILAYSRQTDTEKQLQGNENQLMQGIQAILEKQGTEAARTGELQVQAGIPELQKNLAQYQAQINAINAGAFQAAQSAEGRLAPTFAILGEQAQIERQKSAQTFGLAAAAAATSNQIALAESNVKRAIDAEFSGLEYRLQFQNLLLERNKDAMTREQKKKADILQMQLDERARILADQKAERNSILNLMTTIAPWAPAEVVGKLQGISSFEQAIAYAAPYMQSPEAKLKLEGMKLDNQLARAQLGKIQKETSLIGLPTKAELKAQQEAYEAAKTAVPIAQDKLNLINTLIKHPGLNSAVGPSIPFFPDVTRMAIADLGGAKQDFIASVQQLVNKETIDTLINLKARGGTLGALSDQERVLLQTAATKIGNWAIEKNGQVIGYNASQTSFTKELEEIRRLTQRAMTAAAGNLLSADEKSAIQGYLMMPGSTTPTSFSPVNYFNF